MQIYRSKYLANLSFKVCAKGAHDSDGVGGSGGDGADGHSDGDDRARRLRRHARRSGALRAARRTAGAMLNDEQADIPCRPRRDTLGTVYRASQANLHVVGRRGLAQPGGAGDELCAMFDESSQCTIVLPETLIGQNNRALRTFVEHRTQLIIRCAGLDDCSQPTLR